MINPKYTKVAEKRKGARSIKDISPAILNQLNNGEIETANLVEWLAIDPLKLLTHLLIQLQRKDYLAPILLTVNNLTKKTVNTINEAIGTGIFIQATNHKDKLLFNILATHSSDLVRCWATYSIGKNDSLGISKMLAQIKLFAVDTHFGVREIAWLAVRKNIALNVKESIKILSSWTTSTNENTRRFASEATRPRGVWCEHIELLKQQPELALSILEPLKNDSSKYVQNSIGNWLNDASKTRPDFVRALCTKWMKESKKKETVYIVSRALRTIEK